MKTLLHGHRGTKSAVRVAIYCAFVASPRPRQSAVAFVKNWGETRALLVTAVMLGGGEVCAAIRTFQASASDWSIASNWSGNLVPTAGDEAFISGGRRASVTQPAETCGTLSSGSSAGFGTIEMLTPRAAALASSAT